MLSEDLIQHIRKTAKERKLSRYALAKLGGLHETALKDLYEESWNPRYKTLLKLETGLK